MIRIKFGNVETRTVNSLIFSGGEVHVNIGLVPVDVNDIIIEARITSSSDFMELLMVTDSLKRMYPSKEFHLVMPYIPYARQDRVCQPGDAFSLKVFTKILNDQGYKTVTVADSHSYVATALIDRVIELSQSMFAVSLWIQSVFLPAEAYNFVNNFKYVIAPDAGAAKKAEEFAKTLHSNGKSVDVVQSLKVRNAVGEITSTNVLADDFGGADCLIVDDIIDGGRTFIELAKVLKDKGAGKIGLYATHGIFSKGTMPLFDNGIDFIFTTDSFDQQVDSRVNVIHRFFR